MLSISFSGVEGTSFYGGVSVQSGRRCRPSVEVDSLAGGSLDERVKFSSPLWAFSLGSLFLMWEPSEAFNEVCLRGLLWGKPLSPCHGPSFKMRSTQRVFLNKINTCFLWEISISLDPDGLVTRVSSLRSCKEKFLFPIRDSLSWLFMRNIPLRNRKWFLTFWLCSELFKLQNYEFFCTSVSPFLKKMFSFCLPTDYFKRDQ